MMMKCNPSSDDPEKKDCPVMGFFRRLFFRPDNIPEKLVWLQRRETWAGDVKANFIRMIGLAIFTTNEFINYHILHAVDKRFHLASLIIVLMWFISALLFQLALQRHWLPRSATYLMTMMDVFLLTWILFLADGPKSPLIGIYFLVIALSALRLNPGLVLFTAFLSSFGYLSVWDFAKHQRPEFLIPAFQMVIMLLCLLLEGLILAHGLARVFALLDQISKEPNHE